MAPWDRGRLGRILGHGAVARMPRGALLPRSPSARFAALRPRSSHPRCDGTLVASSLRMRPKLLTICCFAGLATALCPGCESAPAAFAPPKTVAAHPVHVAPHAAAMDDVDDPSLPEESPWTGDWTRTPELNGTLTIGSVTDDEISFDLQVDGPNGHIGQVSGQAERNDRGEAVFRGDNECEIVFELSDDSVGVHVNDGSACSAYHGARCYLDGTFTRWAGGPRSES